MDAQFSNDKISQDFPCIYFLTILKQTSDEVLSPISPISKVCDLVEAISVRCVCTACTQAAEFEFKKSMIKMKRPEFYITNYFFKSHPPAACRVLAIVYFSNRFYKTGMLKNLKRRSIPNNIYFHEQILREAAAGKIFT